jgi:hydrogenase maturation protease
LSACSFRRKARLPNLSHFGIYASTRQLTTIVNALPATDESPFDTLILGIGNVLWADEGFGVRTVEVMNAEYCFPADARLLDGGTQGMFLLPWVQTASNLLIFDAIDFGLAPGDVRIIRDDDVPRYMGAKKMSMHQTGFQEVLAAARLTGEYPERLALIGVQPEVLDDYGGSLRPAIRARIPTAINLGIELLREWGIAVEQREQPLSPSDLIGPNALEMAAYELGRPG